MSNFDVKDWEILRTAAGSYVGKVVREEGLVAFLNPCFEWHSMLAQQQISPSQIANIRMKTIQFLDSGTSDDVEVAVNWQVRYKLSTFSEKDLTEFGKLLAAALQAVPRQRSGIDIYPAGALPPSPNGGLRR